MNLVHLLPVGKIAASVLDDLRDAIPKRLPVRCEILPLTLDPTPSYHPERQQFHSSEILQRMQSLVRPRDWRFLAVAEVDLYIPILKYVFGEAQMGGPCAVVSTFRLGQDFYGLDQDDFLLRERLLKESIHELGHTLQLRHCPDYQCAMASSHSVEWIDLRENRMCDACRYELESSGALRETRQVGAHHKAARP
ncbi:MAG TPA: archaemetzincin [Candidatus Sulfotelmatobacter sp.]|nr:archaemetzincin [Candidatus Sulfotelmatobacter sp.]